MKKTFTKLLFILVAMPGLFAVNLVPTSDLLASYLESDSDLKNAMLDLEKAKLSLQSTEIDKGFSIKLSTGDMAFVMGDNSSFSVKPSVSASMPQYSNLGVDVNAAASVADGKANFDSASAKVSVDIISSASTNNEVSLLKAQRSVLEAQRNLTSKAVDKEKSFYKSLSSLLSSISSIISKQKSLADDKVSFEKVKLQGYTAASASYIRAEMKVLSTEHDLQQSIHDLISNYKLFYISCNREIDIPENIDFLELIPNDIPKVDAVKIEDYSQENYSQLESLLWNQKLNDMTRAANKNYSLSANGGYTVRNSKDILTNSIDLGINGSYEGISGNAKLSLPFSTDSKANTSPSVSIGITYSPNTAKKNQISEKTTEIAVEQEKMKLDAAYDSYNNTVEEKQLKLSDIEWTASTNKKNYELYKNIEKDVLAYYKQGLVSENDYQSAKINRIQAEVKLLINDIDLIVYNSEIKNLFVE